LPAPIKFTKLFTQGIYNLKLLFTFFLFSILYNSIYAQVKLTGRVTGSNNNPIAFAAVTLQNLTSNQKQSLQTDSAGHFEFKSLTAGKFLLTTSFIGYQKSEFELSVRKDTTINVILNTSNTQLGEVVITANKPTLENNAEKLVYNVSSSVTASGSNVLTAIGQVPGIKVSDNEIDIAGKGAVKVMINDRIVQLDGIDLVRYLKSISTNQVSKIEVLKNPGANYDAEGNAGLINITLKQSKKQGYSGNVQVTGLHWFDDPAVVFGTSNYGDANVSANLNYNSAKWSLYGSGNLDEDHELEGFETDLFYPKQTWKQTDTGNYRHHGFNIVAGVDYKLSPKATIGIVYQGGKSTYDGSDHVNNPIYNSSGKLDSTLKTFATYYPVAITNSVNLHTIIKFDTTGKKLLLNADYFNNYRTDHSNFESNSYLADGTVIPTEDTRYFDTNKQNITIYTVKADAEIPAKFAKFSFGGKLSFINTYSNAYYYNRTSGNELVYDPDLSNAFNYTENTQSLYFSVANDLGKWKYQAGIRGELTETNGYSYTLNQNTPDTYFKPFPSVLVSYQADKDNAFSFTVGRRINRPTFWNLNPFKSLFTAYSYGEGNPYLQPEYNTNFELSHNYKNMLTSALFLNVTDNGFNNVTIAKADTNLVYTIPLNFIKTYRYGISENLSLQLFKWLENNDQVSFYHTNAMSDISSIGNIQRFSAYLATNNSIYLNADKSLAIAINFWYQFPEVDHIGLSDPYYKLDIGIKASVFKKKLDLSLNLNDAFGSSATSVTSTIDGVPQRFTNFQLNRYMMMGLSYRFGSDGSKQETRDTGNQDERKRF
jgi:outer membrane receptor protein involved in Fe transport